MTGNDPAIAVPHSEPVLFGASQRFAMRYLPAGTPRARVLMVPPLFEEKRCAHRALATCARALANAGAAVLIPDLAGTGNSGGTLAEMRLQDWLDDLRAAEAFLREHTDAPSCLVALRAGVLPALQARLEAQRFLLWQPVLSGKSYLRQLRTRRMIQDSLTGEAPPVGPHEVEGQELSPVFFAELEALGLPDAPPPGQLRLLQCSFNTNLLTEYARLVVRWGEEKVKTRCIVAEPCWNAHTPGRYTDLAAAVVEEALC
ncbi:MAG: alpha/beta hydrolase family protein [Armatimonadota bacterium]